MTTLASGDGMAELVRQDPPDLVLLDLNLPTTDGVQLCRLLRELLPATLPVLVVTAYSRPAELERALAAGATGHLVKPFSPAELARRVSELLPARG